MFWAGFELTFGVLAALASLALIWFLWVALCIVTKFTLALIIILWQKVAAIFDWFYDHINGTAYLRQQKSNSSSAPR